MRTRVFLLGILPALLLTGCRSNVLPYAHDIERVELVEVLGLDQGSDEESVQVTLSTGVRRTGDSGETKAPLVYEIQGETVYQSVLDIQSKGEGYLSCAHMSNCLLGEEAAQAGLESLVDFLERDPEMRLNTTLYVVQEGSASELIRGSTDEETSVVDRLQDLVEDVKRNSNTWLYTLKDVTVGLEQNGCALAPALKLEEGQAEVTGFACFQDSGLVGYLNREQAMGVNLLEDHVTGGAVSVSLSDGSITALRLKKTSCRWSVETEAGEVTGMTAQITVHAGLEELRGEADPEDPLVLEELSQGLSQTLKVEVNSAIIQLQSWNADALHLEEKAQMEKPGEKTVIAQTWTKNFSTLPIQVEVTGIIDQTYDIDQPLRKESA